MRNGAGVLALFIILSGGLASAQQGKKKEPPPSNAPIKEIMLRTHKEKGALIFKVRDAESSEEENKKLLAEYQKLATFKPPVGDEKSWKNRTAAAIAALQELVDKKSGAVERVRSATECSGCHNAHRVGGNK
ncbi:MAG TPA: hypothetical protein VNM14_09235 [Planctomycetota bacterium]|jgi:hypothetical protein|nr:hypothetical protein [Planctomycetota bacterium]